MNGLISVDGKAYETFTKITNLIILNLLFLVSCIPIITIGPSLAALYQVTFKMNLTDERAITKQYCQALIHTFFKAGIAGIVSILTGSILVLDLYFVFFIPSVTPQLLGIPVFAITFLYVLTVTYLFPLMAYTDDKLLNVIKRAICLSLANLPYSLLLVALTITPVLLYFLFYSFGTIVSFVNLFFGFSFIAYYNSRIFLKIFHKYNI